MEKKNQELIEKGGVQKLRWTAPMLQVLSVVHIKQQEEELLQLLVNEDSFRLLTGSLPS
jgi:hypothetical protein